MVETNSGDPNAIGTQGVTEQSSIFTDGISLFGLPNNNGALNFEVYQGGSNWASTTVDPNTWYENNGTGTASGAANSQQIVIAAATDIANYWNFEVFSNPDGAGWRQLRGAGPNGGVLPTSSYEYVPVPRVLLVDNIPFTAFYTAPSGIPELSLAYWQSSAWSTISNISSRGAGGGYCSDPSGNACSFLGEFDLAVHGNTIYFVYVANNGGLYLRRLNLDLPQPWTVSQIEDVVGPNADLSLNDDQGGAVDCEATGPELANADDGMYIVWQEGCPLSSPSTYQLLLRKLE